MNNQVSETIFSGKTLTLSLADVQHYEKKYSDGRSANKNFPKKGELEYIVVVTKHTKWNFEHDIWENALCITNYDEYKEADKFIKAWCDYRYETDIKQKEAK